MQKDCSVIILAAGYSSRMGCLKFTLSLGDGTRFLENSIRQYSDFGCRQIIVVVNKEGKEFIDQNPLRIAADVNFVVNNHPEYERFYSIKKGLALVKNDHFVFLHNADNPFANQETLKELYLKRMDADFIKPIFKNRGGHPILISNKIVKGINSTNSYKINLNEFLKNYSVKEVKTADEKILLNVNTKDDYKKLLNKRSFKKLQNDQ